MRPFRSVLYMPGSNARALDKARALAADALILDLEDACAPDAKEEARGLIAAALAEGGYGGRYLIVRINGLDTAWGAEDVAAIAAAKPDALLLPKVNGPEDLAALDALMAPHAGYAKTRIWAMMETPRGILRAAEIAAAGGRLEGFVMGTNDLIKDLGARPRADRAPVAASLSLALLAARAEGLACVDGVWNALDDADGLAAECALGRDMGFDGKTLIHPRQLDAANAAFAPSEAELAEAHEFVTAFEAAIAEGKAVAVVRGRIVENLHVATARQRIALAEAIAALESAQ